MDASASPTSIRLLGLAPPPRRPRPDLTLHFDTQALVQALRAAFGPLRDGETLAVPIEARLRDGTPLVGEDLVLVQVPGRRR